MDKTVISLGFAQLILAVLLAGLSLFLAARWDSKYEFSQISGVGMNLFRLTADRFILISVILLGFVIIKMRLRRKSFSQILLSMPILISLIYFSLLAVQDSLNFPPFSADLAISITVLTSSNILFLGLSMVLFVLGLVSVWNSILRPK